MKLGAHDVRIRTSEMGTSTNRTYGMFVRTSGLAASCNACVHAFTASGIWNVLLEKKKKRFTRSVQLARLDVCAPLRLADWTGSPLL
jgi:hypothetical protein